MSIACFLMLGPGCALQSDLVRETQDKNTCLEHLGAADQEIESLKIGLAEQQGANGKILEDMASLSAENDELRIALAATGDELSKLSTHVVKKEQELTEVSTSYDQILHGLRDELQRGELTIKELEGQLTVELLDKILFDVGSIRIRDEGQEVLRNVGEVLKGIKDKRIQIAGHTDDLKITGRLAERYPTNWELSAARAVVVVRFLVEEVGLDPHSIAAVSHSKFQPVESNDTPEGRASNRRIEIILLPIQEEG